MRIINLIVTLTLLIPPSEQATITAVSCQPHPNNTMVCGNMRNGQPPNSKAMACEYNRMGQVYLLEGIGIRYCGDTSRHEVIYGLPHFDVYMNEYRDAVNFGVQERRAWRIR